MAAALVVPAGALVCSVCATLWLAASSSVRLAIVFLAAGYRIARATQVDGETAYTFCARRVTRGVAFLGSKMKIGKTLVLMDSESTVHLFCNPDLMTDIREAPTRLRISSTGGLSYTRLQGSVPGIKEWVWYDPNGIVNILSLARIRKQNRVTFDSAADNAFLMHRPDGSKRRFKMLPSGLYTWDVHSPVEPRDQAPAADVVSASATPSEGVVLVDTVVDC